ncbi:MAG: DMT family transporter [Bacteroidales bacterium]
MRENNKAIFYALIAVLSWSTVATMFKTALKFYTHFEMLIVATLTSLVIFAVALTLRSGWSELKKLTKADWGRFALIGMINPLAYYLVLFKAYALLPAQIAQPINYFWPIILLVLLAIFAKQPIAPHKYIGMAMSLGGVTLISFGSGSIGGSDLSVSGIGLAFLSAFLWAIYWIINSKNKKISDIAALFVSFLFGSIYLCVAACFVPVSLYSVKGFLSSMYVGMFEMGIPFIFFGLAIRKTSNPALVNQLCYLSPFLSLFLIHLFLGEHIYPTTYIGLFLIVTGIAFNEWLSIRKQKAQRMIN